MGRYVLLALGDRRLSDVRRADVQDLVDALVGRGLAGSAVRNALNPLRRIYDRALKRDQIAIDPTDGIEWPGTSRKRDRIVTPAEAAALLDVLPVKDCALWASALYAGMRSGELRALRVSSVDLDAGAIHVTAGMDDFDGSRHQVRVRGSRRTDHRRTAPDPARAPHGDWPSWQA